MNVHPDPLVEELARRRKAAGVTQKDLARRIGSNQSHISDIECGKVDPTLRLLMRYARAIGTRIRVEPLIYGGTPEQVQDRIPEGFTIPPYDIPPTGMNPPDPFKTAVRM